MKKQDFYFSLPKELIAQTPIEHRDHSRLMILNKTEKTIEHKHFYDIINLLNPGDTLVLNNSKVIPARIFGVKEDTNGVVEFLLLNQKKNGFWEVLVKPGKKAKIGTSFIFGDGLLKATIEDVLPDGNRIVSFKHDDNIYSVLDKIGLMPLPPYITEQLKDSSRYQTVYAKERGSAAAPTAGLHFTNELLEKIQQKGVNITYVTLHVGLGTFRPVKEDNILNHKMHTEHFEMSKETADILNQTKLNKKRIIAVGTTSCRTLETIAKENKGIFKEQNGETGIFIYPGYNFCGIDGLITNFHLPESTLIMLISALAGREFVLKAYETAVLEKYRFFSFGDAMFIC